LGVLAASVGIDATRHQAWAAAEATPQLFSRLQGLYDDLEYDAVVPLARQLIELRDASPAMLEKTYLMLGSSLAVIGEASDAEAPFRLLLRLRPDFEMPPDTTPKILAVFRLVQTEERRIAEQVRQHDRDELLGTLRLAGGPQGELRGGQPIDFAYRLRDPRGVVSAVSVQYRRRNAAAFSALALQLGPDNLWHGEIPGEWSNNEDGMELEFYASTADDKGEELISLPKNAAPVRVGVEPGVAGGDALQKQWWFWTIVGVVAAGAAVGGYFIYDSATSLPGDHVVRVP